MGALAGFAAADSSTLPNDMLFLDDSGEVQVGNRENICNRENVSAFDRGHARDRRGQALVRRPIAGNRRKEWRGPHAGRSP